LRPFHLTLVLDSQSRHFRAGAPYIRGSSRLSSVAVNVLPATMNPLSWLLGDKGYRPDRTTGRAANGLGVGRLLFLYREGARFGAERTRLTAHRRRMKRRAHTILTSWRIGSTITLPRALTHDTVLL
jgi:hypothetical protein